MTRTPIVYETTHRIAFSELDPFQHVSTGNYARYFADHRMEGLARYAGWDLPALGTLGFMTWVRRMEIDFIRPLTADQDVSITSFVREFRGPDAMIECTMTDAAGTTVSRCLMIVAHVDARTRRATDWPDELQALFFEAGD
ncbi:acyl-CoA thioesterase [Agromyces cerinus]|uniref:Acyl-CoA thioester hydrolase n=1 Tax=Agromyces cerinus subsp. cerinus TaxID=232089 RepID=A0A1N6I5Y9_9MICO|nr:thioesterase family protein [Agromyces cerinus]SIO27458.1 acyl-CoA thioester hydrolase [Agromyces cerinus subsp. cerinus]